VDAGGCHAPISCSRQQALQAAELREELGKKISAGPCSFFVIVPHTKAAEYDAVAAGGVLCQPGMWWRATF